MPGGTVNAADSEHSQSPETTYYAPAEIRTHVVKSRG
jgi:hypothetical protein